MGFQVGDRKRTSGELSRAPLNLLKRETSRGTQPTNNRNPKHQRTAISRYHQPQTTPKPKQQKIWIPRKRLRLPVALCWMLPQERYVMTRRIQSATEEMAIGGWIQSLGMSTNCFIDHRGRRRYLYTNTESSQLSLSLTLNSDRHQEPHLR